MIATGIVVSSALCYVATYFLAASTAASVVTVAPAAQPVTPIQLNARGSEKSDVWTPSMPTQVIYHLVQVGFEHLYNRQGPYGGQPAPQQQVRGGGLAVGFQLRAWEVSYVSLLAG